MPDRILYGVQRIADHLGLTRRQAAYQIEQGRLPTFKMGALVCATPEALAEHFAKLHAEAKGDGNE
jgi:hypothetical protein